MYDHNVRFKFAIEIKLSGYEAALSEGKYLNW